jgi:hypothetical protein
MPRRDDAPPSPPPAAQYRRIEAWWKPGDPKPMIDTAAPAVAQAIGRCYSARILRRSPRQEQTTREKRLRPDAPRGLDHEALHPRECNWCAYREDDLRVALGYAAWVSRYDEVGGEYHNEDWARFFAGLTPATRDLPQEAWSKAAARRHAAIEDALYGGLE